MFMIRAQRSTGFSRRDNEPRARQRRQGLRRSVGVEGLESRNLLSVQLTVTSTSPSPRVAGSFTNELSVANSYGNTPVVINFAINDAEVTTPFLVTAGDLEIDGLLSGGGREVIVGTGMNSMLTFNSGGSSQSVDLESLSFVGAEAITGQSGGALSFGGDCSFTVNNSILDRVVGGSLYCGPGTTGTLTNDQFVQNKGITHGDVQDNGAASLVMNGLSFSNDTGDSNGDPLCIGVDLSSSGSVSAENISAVRCQTGNVIGVNVQGTASGIVSFDAVSADISGGLFEDTSAPGATDSSPIVLSHAVATDMFNPDGVVSIGASGTTEVNTSNLYDNAGNSVPAAVVLNGNAASGVVASFSQDAVTGNATAFVFNSAADTKLTVADSTVYDNTGAAVVWNTLTPNQYGNLFLVADTVADNGGLAIQAEGNAGTALSDNNIYVGNGGTTFSGLTLLVSNYDFFGGPVTSGPIDGFNGVFGNPDLASAQVLPGAPGDPDSTLQLGLSLPPNSGSFAGFGGDPNLGSNYGIYLDMNGVQRVGEFGAVNPLGGGDVIPRHAPGGGGGSLLIPLAGVNFTGSAVAPSTSAAVDLVLDSDIADLFPPTLPRSGKVGLLS